MARTTLQGGTGAQIWRVSRLYVELYSAWPSAAPTEVWRQQVESYELPGGRLGSCLDGSLGLRLDPRQPLPGGFAQSALYGTRCTLQQYSRLVLVVAVLPSGDEVVVHAGPLGLVKPSGPNLWAVQLLEAGAWRRGAYITAIPSAPMPAGAADTLPVSAPYAAPARVLGNWLAPTESNWTPLTKVQEWWQKTFESFPDAELGVGPDLRWLAGQALYGASVNYVLDYRAQGLASQGRESPPYLTEIRRWAPGNQYVRPPATASRRGNVPMFVPARVADVAGQLQTYTGDSSADWNGAVTGAGSFSISQGGNSFAETVFTATLPANTDLIKTAAAEAAVQLTIGSLAGPLQVYTAGGMSGAPGWQENHYAVVAPGSWRLALRPPEAAFAAGGTFVMRVGVERDVNAAASASGSLAFIGATLRRGITSFGVSYGLDPPGLAYPITTEEAWTLSLPGIHRGPYTVSGLPGASGAQYATTVLRATPSGVWTELRCGPLPYQSGALGSQRVGNSVQFSKGR